MICCLFIRFFESMKQAGKEIREVFRKERSVKALFRNKKEK